MVKKTVHVLHNPKGGWSVKKGGAERSSLHTSTKQDAVKAARIISQRSSSELFIHGMDGKIQRRDSHGGDPFPPRDKR